MSFKLLLNIALIAGFTPFLQATMPSDEFEEYRILNPENPFDREVSEDFKDQDFDAADVKTLLNALEFLEKLEKKEEPKSLTPTELFQIWRPWAMIGLPVIVFYRIGWIGNRVPRGS